MKLALYILAMLPALANAAGSINPNVTQDNIWQTICLAGYTKQVRPPTSYTNSIKTHMLRQAGVDPARASEYELDHWVPLALGGHPTDQGNLVLQRWDGDAGAKKKDRLERKLQRMVCSDNLPLARAQHEIATDWQGAYRRYVR